MQDFKLRYLPSSSQDPSIMQDFKLRYLPSSSQDPLIMQDLNLRYLTSLCLPLRRIQQLCRILS